MKKKREKDQVFIFDITARGIRLRYFLSSRNRQPVASSSVIVKILKEALAETK